MNPEHALVYRCVSEVACMSELNKGTCQKKQQHAMSQINVEQKTKKVVSQKIESDTNCNFLKEIESIYTL